MSENRDNNTELNNVEEKTVSEPESVESADTSNETTHHSSHRSSHHGSHGGHHSSHHRHGHSRRSSRSSKKKNDATSKFWDGVQSFFKKNKKLLIQIAINAVFVVLLIFVAMMWDRHSETPLPDDTEQSNGGILENVSSITVDVPIFGDKVTLVEEAVVSYMDWDFSTHVSSFLHTVNPDGIRLDVSVPVELKYNVRGLPAGYSVSSAKIDVSENADFSDPKVYKLGKDETGVKVYNLKTAKKYYFRITLTLSDGNVTAMQGSFETADTPRILSIEGIGNVRDIGGWKVSGNKVIKQGLLYRGTELEGAVEPSYTLTQNGTNVMLTDLGIRYDMDLRPSIENPDGTNALGANVTHKYYGAPGYAAIFEEGNKETIREIFSDLANKDNYPIYMHCTYGLDRTGTICYLLEALLGVSDTDLLRDYYMSAMFYGSVNGESMSAFVTHVSYLEGDTTQEKVEGYLLSIGVTPEEIASIREIFLEDIPADTNKK